jgi:hypothetical protein
VKHRKSGGVDACGLAAPPTERSTTNDKSNMTNRNLPASSMPQRPREAGKNNRRLKFEHRMKIEIPKSRRKLHKKLETADFEFRASNLLRPSNFNLQIIPKNSPPLG